MAKYKYFECPHCGERISYKALSKLGRKDKAEFFDMDNDIDDELIKKKLREKSIEFGQTERR